MLSALALFVATGAVAGLFAGLLGVGGGLIMVPALIYALPALGVGSAVLTQMAVGTSLTCISMISINSAWAHHRRGSVDWSVVRRLAPGLVIGALSGAALAHVIPSAHLQRIIGIAALLVSLRLFFGGKPRPGRTVPGGLGMSAAGAGIGTLSSLVGIGGGSLTVPFLAWCNVPMVRAVAASAACGIPIAWAGMVGFMITGAGTTARGMAAVGYVSVYAALAIVVASLVFTPMGAALAHRLSTPALKRVFGVLLVVVGVDMLLL